MTLEEIAEVVAIDPRRGLAFDQNDVSKDLLLACKLCSSLVRVSDDHDASYFFEEETYDGEDTSSDNGDRSRGRSTTSSLSRLTSSQQADPIRLRHGGPQGRVLLLAHNSVKEYLISDRVPQEIGNSFRLQEAVCHDFIARCCIKYLIQVGGAGDAEISIEQVQKRYRLMQYSANNWTGHMNCVHPKRIDELNDLKELFCPRGGAYLNWARSYCLEHYDSWAVSEAISGYWCPPPLFIASSLGLTAIVEYLIRSTGANLNEASGHTYQPNALSAALDSRHEDIAELLIMEGSNVDKQSLEWASRAGCINALKMLLDRGLKIREAGPALARAAYGGHQSIVELLLDRGLEIREAGPALASAASRGHQSIVELLLDRGLEIREIREAGPALASAARWGHQSIVELLLDRGLKVCEAGPALASAAEGCNQSIVELLLDRGLEIREAGPALARAAFWGHQSIVELLLDRGLEIREAGPTLVDAAFGGHQSIVELLLDRGLEIREAGPALASAASRGHQSIVELLLDRALRIHETGLTNDKLLSHYEAGLVVASHRGHTDVVELLFERADYVNGKELVAALALVAARKGNRTDIVDLLQSKGAVEFDPDRYEFSLCARCTERVAINSWWLRYAAFYCVDCILLELHRLKASGQPPYQDRDTSG